MDRSNVRESYMRSSYVFNNTAGNANRSFISTALIGDSMSYGDDLRKSRIQNLPNYKKINLGDNLQFIVVFQTIEIQRLSNQVEVLRVKLKETERQMFNAQNYEVQIRQLTEKCFSLERLRQEYCDQIEKLTKICDTLYHENQTLKSKLNDMDYSLKQKFEIQKQKNADLTQQIQKWKTRYQAVQKSKAKQLQDLRNLMECQRKSMIDRQIRQITIRFQNQRSGLENQIRKNRQMLQNRNREIDDLKQKCQKYQISIMQLRNYQNVIADNQNKIVLLNQELLRLSDVLSRKDDQLQKAREKQFKLGQQLKQQQQWQYQNKQLKTNLDNRAREIQDYKVRASRLEDQVGKSREMVHYNEQLTNKLQVSGKQIERLNKVLRTKLDDIEDYKRRIQDKERQMSKLKNLQNQLANYENRIGMLQAENNRINGILKTRLGEIQEWRNKYMKLETAVTSYGNIEKDKRAIEDKLNHQIRINDDLQVNIKRYENDLGNFRNVQGQFKEAERQNNIMNKQIERLNGVIKNYSNEIEDSRIKQSKLESAMKDFKNTQIQMRELNNKINLLTQQKQRLNNLIRNRNDDIQNLQNEKLELHSKINHYRSYQNQINQKQQATKKLNDQVGRLRREIDNWQAKANQAENKGRQLQQHLFINNNEKEKINNMLRNKNNEYDDLRTKYSRMEGDQRKIGELENALNEQHRQITRYVEDMEMMQRNINQYNQELDKQRQISNEFAYKIIVLSCELERMTGSGGGNTGINSREYQELQQDFVRLQNKVVSKNNEIDILNNRISSLEHKVNELVREFNNLLAEVQKSDHQTELLLRKIEEYQDYAKRIHILGAEIDRLQAENKAYDEDARRIRLKFADGFATEKKQEDFNFVMILMALEIENLRSRLDQREINIDQMRRSILQPVRKI